MNEFVGYQAVHEAAMRLYCRSLPEDHRRRYAAIEALKIGYGGVAYVSRVLGLSRRTIYTGIRELEQMTNDDPDHPQRPSGDACRSLREPADSWRMTQAIANEGGEDPLVVRGRRGAGRQRKGGRVRVASGVTRAAPWSRGSVPLRQVRHW